MNVRNGHEFEKVLFLGLGICGNITLIVLLLATGFLRGHPTSWLLLDLSFFNLICLISMLVYFILMCGRTWRKANSSKKFLNISYDLWWYEVIVIPRTHSYSTTNTYTYIHTYIHTCMHACIHTYIHTYMFVVVNFDVLAQASDFRIERRQVVFLWMQDSNPEGSLEPNLQQTECPLTNRLSYRGSNLKLELGSPSLWSASIQPTRPHCRLAFAPGSGDIHVCCC